jgi:hypothetical protein
VAVELLGLIKEPLRKKNGMGLFILGFSMREPRKRPFRPLLFLVIVRFPGDAYHCKGERKV